MSEPKVRRAGAGRRRAVLLCAALASVLLHVLISESFLLSAQGEGRGGMRGRGAPAEMTVDLSPSPATNRDPAVTPDAPRPPDSLKARAVPTKPAISVGGAPADAVGGSAAQTPAGATSSSDFEDRLLAHIRRFRRYPPDWRGAPPKGVVTLTVRLGRGGAVLGVWLAQGSGEALLDREAIATVWRAEPLPAPPPDAKAPFDFTLPIEYGG